MAATVIDSLVVSLGLDPKEFTAGQKKAAQSLLDLRKQAKTDGKAVEDATAAMAAGFGRVTRRVLELGTAFLGLRGLERHLTAMTSQDVQLSRFAQTVGLTAQRISELEMATQRLGGTKAGADSSVQSVAGIVANFQQGKGLPPALQQLFARTGTKVDLAHLTTSSMMTAVATALQREARVNPVLANSYATQIGLDPIFAQMAEQHGAGLMGYASGLGGLAPSQQAIEAAQKIVTAWVSIRQQVDAILQHVIADAGPAVARALGDLAKFLDQHGPELERILGQDIQQFVGALEGANWKEIGSEIDGVAKAADDVAKALGGWGPALRDFAGAWLLLKGIGILRGAGAAAGGLGGGLLAPILGILGADAAMKKYGKDMPHISNGAPSWITNSWAGSIARWFTGVKAPASSDQHGALAKESHDFWVSKGLSSAAAWAMVGNEQGESGFNWATRGDGGNAGGAFQWHKGRRDDILRGTGIDVWNAHTTHQQQLQAAYWEMTQGSDSGARAAWTGLKNAKTMAAGEKAAVMQFERPKYPVADMWKRLGYAQSWSSKMLNHSALSAPGGNVTISGPISIHTQATDAPGIARDMHAALANRVKAAKSNTGLQQ